MSTLNMAKGLILFFIGLVAGLVLAMIMSNYSLMEEIPRYNSFRKRSLLENDSTHGKPQKGMDNANLG